MAVEDSRKNLESAMSAFTGEVTSELKRLMTLNDSLIQANESLRAQRDGAREELAKHMLTHEPALPTDGGGVDKPVPPSGWDLQYETDFDSLSDWGIEDGSSTTKASPWTAYDKQTQNNDNSVNLAKNVTTGPDGLVILGQKESGQARPYTSGEVVGKTGELVVPNYFRAEVTGTFEDAKGVWPCLLWFRPQAGGDGSNGEIDVMEWMGGMWSGTQRRVAITMHNEYGATQDSIKRPLILGNNPWFDPAKPHTYLIEKVPGSIKVWVDGRLISTFTAADKSWWARIMESKDRTWYPRITLQIGSGSATKVVPNPDASFTSTKMAVTSLRLWKQS